MAKVAFIGDQHFGISDGKLAMHKFYERVYTEWMIPLLIKHGICVAYQFGDIFDKRKGVDSFSASEAKRYFFEPLEKAAIQFIGLVGNHDAFFTNTIEVNSPDLLLKDFRNVTLIQEPRKVIVDSTSIDIVPWICRDNDERIAKFIEQSDSEYLFGHFEIEGFAMYKGVESKHGLSREMFKKYEKVFSGHYHTRSDDGNIMYIGTPCEMTWNDYDDPRGIHIFDSDTGELEFFACPFTLFDVIVYDEDKIDFKKNPCLDPESIKDKYIKLIVEKRTDFKKYDRFVAALHELGAHDIKIIEDFSQFNDVEVTVDAVTANDTASLLRQYVDETDTDLDKDRLKRELHLLYVEAQAVE
jgi:DNA repair exonuclease SbcCD nuclease subunit